MGSRKEQRCDRDIEDDNHERNTKAAQHRQSHCGEPVKERARDVVHRDLGVAVDSHEESERFSRHTSLQKHKR